MKQRTRKFLAGLLSFGMLLQAASPLSALAAGNSSASEPTLTVEIGSKTFTISPKGDGTAEADDPQAWIAATGSGSITYEDSTYTFHSGIGGSVSTNGMKITGSGEPSIVVEGREYAVKGDLTVTGAKDVVLTKSSGANAAVEGSADITCSGDVRIKNSKEYESNYTDDAKRIKAVSGDLTVSTTGGNVKTLGTVEGDATIDTTGIVELYSNNSAAVTQKLTVRNASDVRVWANEYGAGAIGDGSAQGSAVFENCTGTIEITNDAGSSGVAVKGSGIQMTSSDSYKIYAGSYEHTATESETLDDCTKKAYIRIEIGATPQEKPVATLTILDNFSVLYTTVTYVLNRYEDGSVSWKNGQDPWKGAVDMKYDTATKTYVFTGTLTPLAESSHNEITMLCSDAENDSILINGNVESYFTVGVVAQTRGAKDVTINADSSEPAVSRGVSADCYGDVSITNPSGAATGTSGLLTYWKTGNVTVTGNSTDPLLGGTINLLGSDDVTFENASGPVTGQYISIENSTGDVKITGSSAKGLMLYKDIQPDYQKADIKAKSLTMENLSGDVGKVKFTRADTTGDYKVAMGDSANDTFETVMSYNTYGPKDVNYNYLYIGTGTPQAAREELSITMGGTVYTFSRDAKGRPIGNDETKPSVSYDADAKVYNINGSFAGNIVINGLNGKKPNIEMYSGTGSIVSGSLTVSDVTEFKATASAGCIADSTLTITADGEVKLKGDFVETVVKAKSLTMQTEKTSLGKVSFTAPDGKNYVANTSEYGSDIIDVPDGDDVNKGYLHIEEDTSELMITSTKTDGSVETARIYPDNKVVGSLASSLDVLYSDGTYKIYSFLGGWRSGDDDYSDVITISGANGNTPSVKLIKDVYGSLVVRDVNDFTMNGCYRKVDVECSGDFVAETDGNVAQSGTIIKAGGSVSVTGTGRADTLCRDTEITSGGDVTIQNTRDGAVTWGGLKITTDGNVTILGNCKKLINGSSTACADITAKTLTMKNESGTVGKVAFTKPAGSTESYVAYTNEAKTETTTLPDGSNVSTSYLRVEPGTAPDPTPTPKPHEHTLGDWEHNETNHWKTCSVCNEKVGEAEHVFDSNGVCEECGYKKSADPTPTPTPDPTPDHKHTAGTEWKSDGTYHWHTCTTCDEDVRLDKALHDFGEDGNAKTCAECGYANPDYKEPDQPDTPDTPDVPDTDDTGSGLGAFVAGAAIGGTVLFVGYEAVTDAILSDLLPAGAATPVNRGQLAWLIWGTKGAPAPANQPAFTDVPNAEMAQAAQWCVEQGIMTAEGGKFSPDGWVPKFKVIETWNNAFPKQ